MLKAGLAALAFLLVGTPALAQSDTAVIESEVAPAKVAHRDSLATAPYKPRANEKAFMEKLPPDERETGSMLDEYDIKGKKGKEVSWFGIVRKVTRLDPEKDDYEVIVEQKYFDGLTDTHIVSVSFNGAGDFKALVRAKGLDLPLLSLVRVYGKVSDEKEGVPSLDVKYVRVFPWKTFTFLSAYAKDRSNPEWRKKCTVELDAIYKPFPDDDYYRKRLGKP